MTAKPSPILLTGAELRRHVSYDPDTGAFHRLQAHAQMKEGDRAGGVGSHGYLRISIGNHLYAAHRLAWLWVHDKWPSGQIDHINGNRLDNRIVNLRDVSARVNQENQRSARSNNAIGLLGVSQVGNRFLAQIVVRGKPVHLGYHDTPAAAHEAYLAEKRRSHEGGTI